jgi:hypothetical protein
MAECKFSCCWGEEFIIRLPHFKKWGGTKFPSGRKHPFVLLSFIQHTFYMYSVLTMLKKWNINAGLA